MAHFLTSKTISILCVGWAMIFASHTTVIAQNNTSSDAVVEVKGIGIKREDALQDALRAAIGKAVGVSLQSETKVENFMVIQDAITTNTKGYISTYNITREGPGVNGYEVNLQATVSLKPLKADVQLLSKSIGGVRFMVAYDPRDVKADQQPEYDFAIERINEYLSKKRYRYIERTKFEAIRAQAMNIMQTTDTTDAGYVQRLGIMADAQFIILLTSINTTSKSEAFDTRTSAKVQLSAKAYDNCTAEGLGTTLLESDWHSAAQGTNSAMRTGIQEAINNDLDKLLGTFNQYIGDWVNNGTPYELRFYQTGGFRDLRPLRDKMKADASFGGDIEITAAENFTKLNCTFRSKPDDLADKILDFSDGIPTLKARQLDVKLIYGRQISFCPIYAPLPEDLKGIANVTTTQKSTSSSPSGSNAVAPSNTPVRKKMPVSKKR